MSIVYQMTSTSSAKTTGAAQTAGTGSKGATAGSGDFLQTLAQSLNGGATGENSSAAAGSLTANPLMFTFAASEDGEQTSITDILSSLFADLDSLDEALENDPSLLGDLQSLIQQMYAQLDANPGIQAEGSDEPTSEAGNPASAIDLAEHPAAVRFVLQDVLTQLIAGMNEPDSTVVKNAPEFKHLLQSLQNQLQDAGSDTSLNKGWTELKSILDTLAVTKDQAVQVAPTHPVQTSKQDSVVPQVLVAAASNTGTKVSVETDSTPTANEFGEVDHSSIITAGELSLRSSGTSAGKPAEPVMQASQFAKEMTQFVVNKLDIVQQKGFSEATISLRPEHLGKLDVQITLQNGQLVARFMTEHTMAKDMLEQQMVQLRSSLQAQGIQVERLEVTQNSSLGSQMYQDGGRQPGSNSQQQRRSREREEQSDDAVTTATLQEELRNWRSEHEEGNDLRRDTFTAEA
ncbi:MULTISPECIES: flagellar hook-length control protein FliK [unclassified Paenibacillus]|uniref:flagellar hook-length control protein FliK n=1 Tax=unclassified Paenibacillus TaxID=185978 RepID=UPI0009A5A527|nr:MULTISPECIES: flagellar hook-length control protein FliK [unclassified Paenibacillus]SLJ97734.1 flagellar hook-length control protein FliK [Paenibacillus sp. RU5A]SOC66891.1 flagellar hook-length control protein FliK [Paenibacillus sp. RU26A]SOC69960.1 flagellar hook-length control protein FliK [Paenibacillus sp. RU5M]